MVRILLVDDFGFSRTEMERLLKNMGHEVIQSASAKDALKIIPKSLPIDMILCNLEMPVLNGIDLLERSYQLPCFKGEDDCKIPYFVLNVVKDNEELIKQAVASGYQAILHKPIQKEELEHVIENMLGGVNQVKKEQNRVKLCPKIVIIDDVQFFTTLIKKLIDPQQYHTVCFTNPKEAFVYLANNIDVDLVITDLMMPELNGIEIFLNLKKEKNVSNPKLLHPFILVTTSAEVAIHEKALQLGFVEVLSKPVDPKALNYAIEHALKRS
jgi:CheY-like chemotaxis protein